MATPSPTLDELRAVCSAARTLNVSVAARQLGMTPSAVSRQVARAEGALEVTLFSRVGRRLELTPAGRMLVDRVGPALQRIDTACLELKVLREGAHLLSLSCVPTFATRWLVPRLPSFLRAHPGLTLSFRPHLQPGEPFPEDLDVAVRYGDGLWADVHSDYIDGRLFIVVASAEYPAPERVKPATRERLRATGKTVLFAEELGTIQLWATDAGVRIQTMDGRTWIVPPTRP